MNSHLTTQQMLEYLDGESSRFESRRAEEHLHSCWTCRSEVERLKADISTILDAQKESFSSALPPPPRPWASFDTLLRRALPAQPASLWFRVTAYFNAWRPLRVFMVSGVIAVLMVFGYSIFRSKPVSAKEVLRRLQIADTNRTAITKNQVIRERVHIRKSTRGKSRAQSTKVDTWKSPTTAYWNTSDNDAVSSDLKAQYKAHNVPIGLPLSAASATAWGEAVGGNPIVSQQGSDVDVSFAGVETGTSSSVERVSLLIEQQTWQVKQMTLEFPDASFEVTEDEFAVMPTSAVPMELLAHLEPETSPNKAMRLGDHPFYRSASGSIHLPAVDLDKAELDVFTTLHNLHADLGEPVTVTRSARAVRVGVWQLSTERQDELREALGDRPGVQVELAAPRSEPRARMAGPQSAMPPDDSVHVTVDSNDDNHRLMEFFGSVDNERKFTSQTLATSSAILSDLYALRNLQGQFPPDKEQALAPEARTKLAALVQAHTEAVSANLGTLQSQLAPLNAAFNISTSESAVNPMATDWQNRSLDALETARAADRLLRSLLTTSQTPVSPESALPQIEQHLSHLSVALKTLNASAH